jgi:hypothetical protein
MLKIGDTFTIAGVGRRDPRWWPRFKAWALRRPPPMLGPQQWVVTRIVP